MDVHAASTVRPNADVPLTEEKARVLLSVEMVEFFP
jgi:hypothetical protein